MEEYVLVEKYRPKTIEDVIGNDDLKSKLLSYIEKGEFPNLLFYGGAGTGKSSVARILVNSIDCDYKVFNASSERGIDIIRENITNFAQIKSSKKFKVVVLEEADNMTADASKSFKVVLEDYYKTTRFILTTNHIDRIYDPILSRVQKFEFKPSKIEDVIERCKFILNAEKIEYDETELKILTKITFPDLRQTINSLQKFAIDGKLKLSKELVLQEKLAVKLASLISNPSNESINKIRTIFGKLYNIDFSSLYTYFYKNVESFCKDESKLGDMLLQINESMVNSTFCVNKEMNFISCCISLMRVNSDF